MAVNTNQKWSDKASNLARQANQDAKKYSYSMGGFSASPNTIGDLGALTTSGGTTQGWTYASPQYSPYVPNPGGFVNAAKIVGGLKGLNSLKMKSAVVTERVVDTHSLIRGINGLLYKIAEMKGAV